MAVNKSKIVEQAQKYTAKGQFDKAITEYLRVVKAEPGDIRTWLKIGDLYTRKGSRKEATETYLKVADHYTKSGFYLKAVAVYKQILKLDPTLLEVHELLAKSYLDLGLSSEALIQLEQLADMYQRTGRSREMLGVLLRMGEIDPHNIATRLRIAEHLSKEERIPEAVEHFAAACTELRAQGRSDDYVKVAERLLYHDSTRVDVAREVARIYVERGQYKRALSRLQLCFVKDPRDVATLELLARAFHGLEQPEKAVSVYREMAGILKERGDQAAYVETMRSILAIDPSDAVARAAVQGAGPRLSSQAPAPRVAEALPEDGLWSPADALSSLRGETTLGSSSIEVIPESHPASTMPNEATGPAAPQLSEQEIDERSRKILSETEVLLKYGLKERACEHLRRVFELDPYNIDAREKLKDLLLEMGSIEEALDQLFLLADVFKESQPEGSVYYLHEVLRIAPDNELARQLLSELGGVMPEELDATPAASSEESTFVGARVLELEEESSVAELELDDIDGPVVGIDEPTSPQRTRAEQPTAGGQESTLHDIPYVGPPTGPLDVSSENSVNLSEFAEVRPDVDAVAATASRAKIRELSSDVLVAEEDDDEFSDEEEVVIEDDSSDEESIEQDDVPVLELDEDLGGSEYDDYLTGRAPEAEPKAERDGLDSEPPTDRHPMAAVLSAEDVEELPPAKPSREPSLPPSDLIAIDRWETPPLDAEAVPTRLSERAPEPTSASEEKSLPAESVEWPDLSAEVAEVEFFLDQNLVDEALQIIEELETAHPGHPTLAVLRRRLPGAAAETGQQISSPEPRLSLTSDGLFDAADLAEGWVEDDSALGSARLDEHMSGQFRVEVKDHVEETDFATHFDLGMAYREMGLSDEAIKEFSVCARDPSRAGQAKMMIGLCYVSAGDPEAAIRVFEEGLQGGDLVLSDRLGLLYELGKLHEERGHRESALACYENIVAEDPAFADVVERINRMQ